MPYVFVIRHRNVSSLSLPIENEAEAKECDASWAKITDRLSGDYDGNMKVVELFLPEEYYRKKYIGGMWTGGKGVDAFLEENEKYRMTLLNNAASITLSDNLESSDAISTTNEPKQPAMVSDTVRPETDDTNKQKTTIFSEEKEQSVTKSLRDSVRSTVVATRESFDLIYETNEIEKPLRVNYAVRPEADDMDKQETAVFLQKNEKNVTKPLRDSVSNTSSANLGFFDASRKANEVENQGIDNHTMEVLRSWCHCL